MPLQSLRPVTLLIMLWLTSCSQPDGTDIHDSEEIEQAINRSEDQGNLARDVQKTSSLPRSTAGADGLSKAR